MPEENEIVGLVTRGFAALWDVRYSSAAVQLGPDGDRPISATVCIKMQW